MGIVDLCEPIAAVAVTVITGASKKAYLDKSIPYS